MHCARIVSIITLLTLLSFPVFSDDIKETGHGRSEAEAIAAADSLLAQRIATNTASEQHTIISDDGETAISYFSLNAVTTYDTDFLGAILTTKEEEDGSWSATKTIPESSLPLYESKVQESASIINGIWNDIERDGTIDRESYTRLSAQLSVYEVNSIIMRMLNPNADIPSVPTNSTDVEALYQSSLEKESNLRATTVRELQLQSEMGIITAESQRELNKAISDLAESRREQNALRQQQEMESMRERESFNAAQRAMIEAFSQNIQDFPDSNDDSASSMITEIEALRGIYNTTKNQIQMEMDEYETNFAKEAAREKERIYSQPYFQFELDSGGTPLPYAKEEREAELRESIGKIRLEYENLATKAYADAIKPFEEIAQRAANAIEDLNDAKFTISTPSSAISTSVDYFNLQDLTWHGKAEITIGNQTVPFEFIIPFSSWTGRDIGKNESYYDYRMEIQDWSTILATYPFSYSITINYTIHTYADTSTYNVEFSDYIITRTDTGKKIYHASTSQNEVLDYNTPVDFSDIPVGSSLINEDNASYPNALVRRIANKTEKLTYSYEREQRQREISEAEAKERTKKERQNFKPCSSAIVSADFRYLTNSALTEQKIALNAKVLLGYDLLGLYPSISMLMTFPSSDFFGKEEVTGDLSITFGLEKYFAIAKRDAIKLAVGLGFSAEETETSKSELHFSGTADIGYFHSFGLVTFELGANITYIENVFLFGGYAGLGLSI